MIHPYAMCVEKTPLTARHPVVGAIAIDEIALTQLAHDGAVSGDERGRSSVADYGVILNAGVAALTNGIYSLPALGR
jgi:hypothetical protein